MGSLRLVVMGAAAQAAAAAGVAAAAAAAAAAVAAAAAASATAAAATQQQQQQQHTGNHRNHKNCWISTPKARQKLSMSAIKQRLTAKVDKQSLRFSKFKAIMESPNIAQSGCRAKEIVQS